MTTTHKILHEINSILLVTLFFASWIGALLLIKHLLLAEYSIATYGYAAALLGSLILAKVVLILERVPLGRWVASQPAIVDVIVRTTLYGCGVVIVMAIERGIKERHEYGGFVAAIEQSFIHADVKHVWVNAFCITAALFAYNALAVIRHNLGRRSLLKIFLSPVPRPAAPSEA